MDKVAQYRMWMKSKSSNKSHFEASSEAFGALIWPRRSYNCSFCRREFKSAQGLGGHMNVHRRERARLNNQLSPRPSSHDQSMVSSRVSAPSSTLENYMVSSIIKEHSKVPLFSSPPLSWSDSITTRDFSISDSIIDGEDSSLKPYSEVQNEGDEQSIPFFLIPCSFSRNHQSSETVGLSRGTIEDLDLELRLGDRPKVK